jgi:hypothetical protein
MPGAHRAFQNAADARHVHFGGEIPRVYALRGRGVAQIDALGGELFKVRLQRTGVFGEVLVWAELLRIYKDINDYGLPVSARLPRQRDMPGMQRAHGGNENHPLPRGAEGIHVALEVGYGACKRRLHMEKVS